MGSPIEESMPYPPSQRIWRYMDLAKYLDILRTRSLYLSSLAEFLDPWEGATGIYDLDRDVARLEGIFEGATTENSRQFAIAGEKSAEAQRRLAYVSCWHANDSESAAMWNLYGMTGNAIAIESTIQRLSEVGPNSPDTDGPAEVLAVRYHDLTREPLPHEDAFNLLAKFAYKRPSFQHEQEIRLVHYLVDMSIMTDSTNQISLALAPKGRAFNVDLDRLVSRVVVSPEAASWFRDVVVDATKKYEFSFPVEEQLLRIG